MAEQTAEKLPRIHPVVIEAYRQCLKGLPPVYNRSDGGLTTHLTNGRICKVDGFTFHFCYLHEIDPFGCWSTERIWMKDELDRLVLQVLLFGEYNVLSPGIFDAVHEVVSGTESDSFNGGRGPRRHRLPEFDDVYTNEWMAAEIDRSDWYQLFGVEKVINCRGITAIDRSYDTIVRLDG